MAQLFNAIGLMSGTSLDGIDVAFIETDGEGYVSFKGALYHPYDVDFKQRMQALAKGDIPLNDVLRLEQELTLQHAHAVKDFLKEYNLTAQDVDIIGFHGQTIRHLPDEGLTWQLGNASLLSHETGIQVCADMRRRDMAAGGQGAPLAPLYHAALFAEVAKPLAIVNIGGVSNFTFVGEDVESIHAGDCGPGMGLLDAFVYSQTDGKALYDDNGTYAKQGNVDKSVLEKAFSEINFFQQDFPKSADRYDFDSVDVSHLSLEDGCATLAALTVDAIVLAIKACPELPKSLWVTGGGSKNAYVMEKLTQELGKVDCSVETVEAAALRIDSMEAECFAWLAVRSLNKKAFSSPNTTGCQMGVVGGILTSV